MDGSPSESRGRGAWDGDCLGICSLPHAYPREESSETPSHPVKDIKEQEAGNRDEVETCRRERRSLTSSGCPRPSHQLHGDCLSGLGPPGFPLRAGIISQPGQCSHPNHHAQWFPLPLRYTYYFNPHFLFSHLPCSQFPPTQPLPWPHLPHLFPSPRTVDTLAVMEGKTPMVTVKTKQTDRAMTQS